MSVRIRMLTNRRLEHLAARTLRLHLRHHLRAWQDATSFYLHVSSRFQRATRESVLKCLQDWKDFLVTRGAIQQNLGLLCGALLVARQNRTTAWIEEVKRGQQAEDVVEMRSNSLTKKAALDHWRVKCVIISAMLPGTGVQRRHAQTLRAVRKCFVEWNTYTKYHLSLGRKLSCFICRRVDQTVAIYFDSWVSFARAQRVMLRRTQRALHFMRQTSCASIFSSWKIYHVLHRRKCRLHQVCAARSQRRGDTLLSTAVKHWQGITQCGKVHDEMSLRMTAKDEITSRLQHLACAQLLKSAIAACETVRERQHFAIRALFTYVRQKKQQRRTRQLMLLSTAVRRKTRRSHTVWKMWYQQAVSSRLEAIEQHISTFAQLATSVETRRETHEQSMEEMTSILRLRFASWETELLETQTLLHASCESFLPDTGEAQMNTSRDYNNLSSLNSTSHSAVSHRPGDLGMRPGSCNVASAREGGRRGEREHGSHGGAQLEGVLGWSVTPCLTSAVGPHQDADMYIGGREAIMVNVVKSDGKLSASGGDRGDGDGEQEPESRSDSELSPFEAKDVEDKWQRQVPRPVSPAHCTNANPQE